jgi:glycine/D-amino acid oxidase-like deaminating enzyme
MRLDPLPVARCEPALASLPHFDVAIVGAGIVGLATARHLLLRFPTMTVCVLEKEDSVASHQVRWIPLDLRTLWATSSFIARNLPDQPQ